MARRARRKLIRRARRYAVLRQMFMGYTNLHDIARESGMTMERTHQVLSELLYERVVQYNPHRRGEEWELPA